MKRFLLASLLAIAAAFAAAQSPTPLLGPPARAGVACDGVQLPPVSTFSIVAIDPQNGDLGVAVASRYFSVGSVVPWALAGVGAVATQANVNVGYGPQGIDLLRQGMSAQEVLTRLLADDVFQGKDGRQVAIVDAKGSLAAYTGPNAPKWAGDRQGKTWSAQGNILVGPQVVEDMGKAFDATSGELAEKLFAALKAGDGAGGDSRGRQSASMLVVRKGGGRNINNDRYIFINVDDNPDPFKELRRLLDLNLSYNYGDQMYKAMEANDLPKARAAAQKAITYSPNNSNTHMQLGFLNYALGDKKISLDEFSQARTLRPDDFVKRWHEEVESPPFKSMRADQDFMKKLFPPDGNPPPSAPKGNGPGQ